MNRVYFIKPVGMDGPIKIGTSFSPDGRRKTLATWSPFPLEIVAEIAGGYRLERRFHAKFEKHHQRREWFEAAPELLAAIKDIQAGSFDLATLPSGKVVTSVGKGGCRGPRTVGFRYRASVMARVRTCPSSWCQISSDLERACGQKLWNDADLWAHRAAVENVIAQHGAKPSKIDWLAAPESAAA